MQKLYFYWNQAYIFLIIKLWSLILTFLDEKNLKINHFDNAGILGYKVNISLLNENYQIHKLVVQ